MRIQKKNSSSSSSFRTTPPTSNVSGTNSVVEDMGICENDNTQSSVGSLEEDWDLASEESASLQLNPYVERRGNHRSGELILSGDEDSSYGGGNDVAVQTLFRTAADLSLPGTDSLPTDLDSLDVVSYIPESAATSMRSRPLSTATVETDVPREGRQNNWRFTRAHLLPLLLATSTITTMLSVYLAWDRHAWRASALLLEAELDRLQLDLKENQEASRRIAYGDGNRPTNSSDFDWNHVGSPRSQQKIVLADNCWLHAEAAVSFGECAETVQDVAKSLLGKFASAGSALLSGWAMDSEDDANDGGDFFSFNDGRPQTAGITIQDVVESTSSIATATAAAGDALRTAVSDISGLVDDYVSMVVNVTRDAIEDGSFHSHLD